MGEYKGGRGDGKEVEERHNKNTFYLINKAKNVKKNFISHKVFCMKIARIGHFV